MDKYVIDDPGSLGWDYDEDTGRWTWGGSGSNSDGGGFPEAPIDGKQYGRQDAGWTEVVKGGGSGGNDPRIADQDISNWNTSFSWGDHSGAGYLTAETDPTVPSHVKSITTSDIDNWNSGTGGGGGGNDARITDTQITEWDASYGWGNHAGAGYLTSFDETDPTVPDHVKAITANQISTWDAGTGGGGGDDPRITATQISNWDTAFGWGSHAAAGYATQSWVTGKGYATTSWVTSNYQPKGTYLTSSSLTGYATQSWVSSNYASIPTLASYYTGAQCDAKYEAKGAGGGSTDTLDDVCKRNATTIQSPSAPNWYSISNTYTLGGIAGGGARIVSIDGKFVFYKSDGSASGVELNTNGNVQGKSFTSKVGGNNLVTVYGNAIANSGTNAAGLWFSDQGAGSATVTPCRGTDFAQVNNRVALGNPNYYFSKVWSSTFRGAQRSTQNNGDAVLSVNDLIDVMQDLRAATKDERTVESLRDAIGNCVGGIIEKLEAIQSEAKETLQKEIEEFEESERNQTRDTQ